MHPKICSFPDYKFYDSKIKDHKSCKEKKFIPFNNNKDYFSWPDPDISLAFIDIIANETETFKDGLYNEIEANEVVRLVK